MEHFNTLREAVVLAATRCQNWRFATSNDTYDVKGLLITAEMSDNEDPVDEDSYYVVSPVGSIGLCDGGEDIDWLFLSGSGADENLPPSIQHVTQRAFCTQCGAALVSGARFCGHCGYAL